MLVMLIEDKILPPQQVCQSCLLADTGGKPRWRQGKLCCGNFVGQLTDQHPEEYECMMGFCILKVE